MSRVLLSKVLIVSEIGDVMGAFPLTWSVLWGVASLVQSEACFLWATPLALWGF